MRLYTVLEIANMSACSVKLIRAAINSGELKAVRLGKSARSDRVHPDEYTRYLESREWNYPCHSISVVNIGGLAPVSPVNELDDLRAAKEKVMRGRLN